MNRSTLLLVLAGLLAPLAAPSAAEAQYFGRNKVQYESFDFRVLATEHFDIYHYGDPAAALAAGRMSERWYARLSRLLDYELSGRQPFILYQNHPHFRQTVAISGGIGEGTGGVTEALKRRMIQPMAGPLGETDHVIGHELVHAFQYSMSGVSPTAPLTRAPAISGLPLWAVEGMAEYLSVGPRSPLTAMWMRDAVRSEEPLPGLRALSNPNRYFPYRWGHALWAYIGGRWGDDAVRGVFRSAMQSRSPGAAFTSVLDVPADRVMEDWHAALRDTYGPLREATGEPADFASPIGSTSKPRSAADSALGTRGFGPVLSPDGERMVYLTSGGRFSLDLYLADARTGRTIRRLTRTDVDPHYQSLQFISSAGAWAPDGRRFAFAAVRKGKPLLAIVDTETGRRVRDIPLPSLGEVFNPTWSPDGNRIAFAGNADGFLDLYTVSVEGGDLRRLTDDQWSEVHPDWSPDGSRIAFATDRYGGDLETLEYGPYQLAAVNVETGQVERLPSLEGAKNVNPRWGPQGQHVYFISNAGGISNVYRASLDGSEPRPVTNVYAGVAGITDLSPALSVAAGADAIAFTAFREGGYHLYRIDGPEPLTDERVRPRMADRDAGALPPVERRTSSVAEALANSTLGLPDTTTFRRGGYRSRLGLDYISQPSFSLGISTFGSAFGAGASLHFSDMLGYHNLTTQLNVNVVDGNVANGVGGVVQYLNRSGRLNWGLVAGQVPQVMESFGAGIGDFDGDGNADLIQESRRFWEISRQAAGLVSYPLDEVQRVQFSAGFQRTDYELERTITGFSGRTGRKLGRRELEVPACSDSLALGSRFCSPDPMNQIVSSAAYVYDTSLGGPTGPIVGRRAHLELAPAVGTLDYLTAVGDLRQYLMPVQPLTLAGRVMHWGRWLGDSESPRVSRLYLGQPSLVRGYSSGSFDLGVCPTDRPLSACEEVRTFERMFGSRLALANLEARLPLFGPLGAVSQSVFLPVDLIGFFDAGVAWTADEEASFLGGPRDPVTSAGAGLRINLLGFALGEVAWVYPFERPEKGGHVTFNLTAGF